MINTGVNSSANSRNGGIGFREDNVDNKTVAVPVGLPDEQAAFDHWLAHEHGHKGIRNAFHAGSEWHARSAAPASPASAPQGWHMMPEKLTLAMEEVLEFGRKQPVHNTYMNLISAARRTLPVAEVAPASPAQDMSTQSTDQQNASKNAGNIDTSPAASLAQQDERSAFEQWAIQRALYLTTRPDGEYASSTTQEAWDAWQARAAITAPQDAQERDRAIRHMKVSGELAAQVNDLSMLTRRLIHALNNASPANPIAKKAADYLKRNGLQGSPLRAEDVLRTTAQPADKPEDAKREKAEAQQLRYALRSLQYIADGEQGDPAKFAALSIKHITCGTYKPEAVTATKDEQAEPLRNVIVDILGYHGWDGRLLADNYGEAADDIIEAIPRPPAQPQLSDEEIREVFLANGFTIKEGCTDLKPYVYQAARALLSSQSGENKSADGGREG